MSEGSEMLHHVVRGAGRPVLILHGGKLDHRHMLDALEPVFEGLEGYQRIYIDLPGHGLSPADAEIETQDDVLERVIGFAEQLGLTRSLLLVGESRGSHLARAFALTRPDMIGGLMLIVPGGIRTDSPRPRHRTITADPEARAELAEEEHARFDRLVVQSRRIVEKIRATKMPAVSLHDAGLEARIQTSFEFSFAEEASKAVFDRPSLIVSGRQDSISGYADALDMLDQFPRATFALLDCAGHSLTWERPDIFKSLVHDWLARLT